MRLRIMIVTLVAGALALAGCGGKSSSSTSSTSSGSTTSTTSTTIGFEGVPLEQGPDLAPGNTPHQSPVDGVQCGLTERLDYHIHAHLAVYVSGQSRALPPGIGI